MKILLAVIAVSLFGCSDEDREYTYVVTDRGLLGAYGHGYMCAVGMVVGTSGRLNVYDENNNPITCSGYIELTRKQAKDYRLNTGE